MWGSTRQRLVLSLINLKVVREVTTLVGGVFNRFLCLQGWQSRGDLNCWLSYKFSLGVKSWTFEHFTRTTPRFWSWTTYYDRRWDLILRSWILKHGNHQRLAVFDLLDLAPHLFLFFDVLFECAKIMKLKNCSLGCHRILNVRIRAC
jgi:hypothetical protein